MSIRFPYQIGTSVSGEVVEALETVTVATGGSAAAYIRQALVLRLVADGLIRNPVEAKLQAKAAAQQAAQQPAE